jgi:hypothetical protein
VSFWLLMAAAAVAAGSDDGSDAEPLVFHVVPWTGPPPVSRAPAALKERLLAFSADGQSVVLSTDVPRDAYQVRVSMRTIDIGYRVKLGGTEYGAGWGPDGSAPVLRAIAKAASVAAKLAPAAAASGNPYAMAGAAAVTALDAIVSVLPDLVKRARVKVWTEFRAGRWGSGSKRQAIRDALARWYSRDVAVAAKESNPHGYWRFEGNSAGTWPVVTTTPSSGTAGEPISGPPAVVAESLQGDYLRITITTPTMDHPGECRWDVVVLEDRGQA